MAKHEPYYDSELSLRFGLDTERFDVAVDKRKRTGGRKVIVCERDKQSERYLIGAASGRMTKEELDRHAKAKSARACE